MFSVNNRNRTVRDVLDEFAQGAISVEIVSWVCDGRRRRRNPAYPGFWVSTGGEVFGELLEVALLDDGHGVPIDELQLPTFTSTS